MQHTDDGIPAQAAAVTIMSPPVPTSWPLPVRAELSKSASSWSYCRILMPRIGKWLKHKTAVM